MKEEAKKKWGKPKLIVLLRNSPEEGVLSACKHSAGTSAGGDDVYKGSCLLEGCSSSCNARTLS